MRKLLITIVSRDRPGIIHEVSRVLADHQCSVLEVSQTTLLGEFAGLFSCAMPDDTDIGQFTETIGRALEGSGLAHWVTDSANEETKPAAPQEPYVVTLRGRDRMGVIPVFSGAIAGFDVNIDNLRAVSVANEHEDNQVVMFFELSVPKEVNKRAFRQALSLMAEELGIEMSLQHRDIFEAIHRL
ncbi:MAG: ACT domain-containing protein [Candidatus Adiutrix sp.]|jgi:glycine cleavage system transcriptional repressor|nr:ACT domain-containing protein [Candidatus Adiutrix sp.]